MREKRKIVFLLIAVLAISWVFTACGSKSDVLKVGASPEPHARILNNLIPILAEKGIELKVIEFTDYVQPNLGVDTNDLDANYFQHMPYLTYFNEENKTDIVSVGAVHFEPLGIYPGRSDSLEGLKDNAIIAVPSDTTNEARALLLLEASGLIKLKEGADLETTVIDIVDNPKNLVIKEIQAEQLPRVLPDVDLAVINGNYALEAGLGADDALALEDRASEAAETFANIVAVKKGNEDKKAIKLLIEALTSEETRKFIEQEYPGIVPTF